MMSIIPKRRDSLKPGECFVLADDLGKPDIERPVYQDTGGASGSGVLFSRIVGKRAEVIHRADAAVIRIAIVHIVYDFVDAELPPSLQVIPPVPKSP